MSFVALEQCGRVDRQNGLTPSSSAKKLTDPNHAYLSTRVIVLPFQNIPELVSATPFRISLNPGSSYEDAFKTSRDPDWMVAWTERIEPHLADYTGRTTRLVQLIQDESTTALYDNYFAVM